MQPQLNILSPELIPQILDEAFQLLVNPGIKVQLIEARTLLGDASASVDEEREVVRIPEEVARNTVSKYVEAYRRLTGQQYVVS